MEHLKVTEYGTIKGNGKFDEITIDNFLIKIEKDIKRSNFTIDNTETYKITYGTYVKVAPENNDRYYITIDGNEYYLVIDSRNRFYPILKSNLERISKISNEELTKGEIINQFETSGLLNGKDNSNDLKIYLEFLIKARNKFRIEKIKYILALLFGPLCFPTFFIIGLFNEHYVFPILALISFVITIIAEMSCKELFIFQNIKKLIKRTKLINLKIKAVTKRLNIVEDVKLKIASQVRETTEKKDIYKNTILGYMNSIMLGANKLNNKERKNKLTELRDILDEYTARMQEFNNKKEKGLTLENDEHVIAHEIIDKLTALEMEIAELKKIDNENKKITSESDLLREKIDEYLHAAMTEEAKQNNDKKRTLSR